MANELKQTPTESLFFIMESFIAKKDRIHLKGVLEQAKEMEKEQIKQAYQKGVISLSNRTADEYYEQTFNK